MIGILLYITYTHAQVNVIILYITYLIIQFVIYYSVLKTTMNYGQCASDNMR